MSLLLLLSPSLRRKPEPRALSKEPRPKAAYGRNPIRVQGSEVNAERGTLNGEQAVTTQKHISANCREVTLKGSNAGFRQEFIPHLMRGLNDGRFLLTVHCSLFASFKGSPFALISPQSLTRVSLNRGQGKDHVLYLCWRRSTQDQNPGRETEEVPLLRAPSSLPQEDGSLSFSFLHPPLPHSQRGGVRRVSKVRQPLR
jgi:hypothetical protein